MNKRSVGSCGSFAGWAGVLLLAAALPLAGQTAPAAAAPAAGADVEARARPRANIEARAQAAKAGVAKRYQQMMSEGLFARLAATPVNVKGHYLALADSQAGLAAKEIAAIRDLLQRNLNIPVWTVPGQEEPVVSGLGLLKRNPTNLFAVVVLTRQPAERLPALTVHPDERLVIINVAPLGASGQLAPRAGRQALRGLGLVFGLGLAGDPFSVMRPLDKGLAELDTFSQSFAPAESLRFNQHAETRGYAIQQINIPYPTKVQQGLMPPINPQFWPVWEKKHRKSPAAVFRQHGFDPDEIAAEYRRLKQEGKQTPAQIRKAKANAKP